MYAYQSIKSMMYVMHALLKAGASIVADNMQGLDSAGVNAMVPGLKSIQMNRNGN